MRHPSDTNPPIERLQITGLVYGPHGVGRLNGKVIFVRSVVAGEEVAVTLREDRGSFAYADLRGVLRPAPERRVPPCPYLPRCGGCPWQHLTYPAQLRAKEQNLRGHLARIAGLSDVNVLPIIPSPQEFSYRSRLTLRVEAGRVGFYAGGSHDLVAVDHCMLASAPIDAAIRSTAALLRQLRTNVRRIEISQRDVSLHNSSRDVVMLGEAQGGFADEDGERIAAWLAKPESVAGFVLQGKGWRHTWGDDRIRISPEIDLTLSTRAGAFTQINPEANRVLVRTVLELGEFAAGDHVLDVYAGVGNLSLPIARRVAHVVAVEHHRLAAEDARANAAALGLANYAVRAEAAHRALRALRRARAFDAVVLDPPRSGAANIIDALLDLRAARLIAVSCNPATLARDLKRLADGYRIVAVQPIDLFPHSYHVEAVVKAVLT